MADMALDRAMEVPVVSLFSITIFQCPKSVSMPVLAKLWIVMKQTAVLMVLPELSGTKLRTDL